METNPIRNGKFVAKEDALLTARHREAIAKFADKLSGIFPNNRICIKPLGKGQCEVHVTLFDPMDTGKKYHIKGKGEIYIGRDSSQPTEIIFKFRNEEGYANDPFYSNDYVSWEEQLTMYILCTNILCKDLWKRNWCRYEPKHHYGYAYEVEDICEETVIQGIKEIKQDLNKIISVNDSNISDILKADNFDISGTKLTEINKGRQSPVFYRHVKK